MGIAPKWKSGAIGLISCIFVLGIPQTNAAGAAATLAAGGATNQSPRMPTASKAVRISPRLAEIVRMVKARLAPEVIKTFISSSTRPFNPTAADIVALQGMGVAKELITAMLERDGALQRNAQNTGMHPGASAGPGTLPSLPYRGPEIPPETYSPAPNYFYPRYIPLRRPRVIVLGPLSSFNNSYPTVINGQPVYSGYYVPGFGY